MNAATSRAKKSIRDMVAADLARFDLHRGDLLDVLITVRKRGLGPVSFDAEVLWPDIARLAQWYFWRERTKPIPNGVRTELLGQLVKALGRACAAAKEDGVVDDLFRSIYEAANGPLTPGVVPNIDPSAVSRSLRIVTKSIEGMLILESAARRAAANVHRRDGRPKGTSALPSEYVVRLAMLFRSSTGRKPGAGAGPFARFVSAFLDAIGRRIADGAVIAAIKSARTQSLQRPSGWPTSPFK
jgi:hypothetical protein